MCNPVWYQHLRAKPTCLLEARNFGGISLCLSILHPVFLCSGENVALVCLLSADYSRQALDPIHESTLLQLTAGQL